MTIPKMEDMLKAGMHFGHQTNRWHPKMAPYLYTTRNGLHIFDLKKTQKNLEEALQFIEKTVADGGDVLFVGTKSQARPIVEEYAKQAEMPYIRSRWIGGMLTNFSEVKKSIRRYVDLQKQKQAGEWEKYTKKEQILLQKEVDKLDASVAGLVSLDRMPKAVFIVDTRTEKTALKEANVMNIPVVAVCDSNVNPTTVKKVIPANDDATKGIEIIVKLVAEACASGKKKRKVVAKAKPAKKVVAKKEATAKVAPKKTATKKESK